MSLTEEDKQWITEQFEAARQSDPLARAEHVLAAHIELSRRDRQEYIAWKKDFEANVEAIWKRMHDRDVKTLVSAIGSLISRMDVKK